MFTCVRECERLRAVQYDAIEQYVERGCSCAGLHPLLSRHFFFWFLPVAIFLSPLSLCDLKATRQLFQLAVPLAMRCVCVRVRVCGDMVVCVPAEVRECWCAPAVFVGRSCFVLVESPWWKPCGVHGALLSLQVGTRTGVEMLCVCVCGCVRLR